MHVVRELVDWAAHGGDFIFQGVPLDMTHVACSRQNSTSPQELGRPMLE